MLCFEESAQRYLQISLSGRGIEETLRHIHISVSSSWAKFGSSSYLPHVHPKVALAGSLYLDCAPCGIYLLDPRPPAGMAEVPEALRKKLKWGEVQEVQVKPGSLVLYPAWLQHAPLANLANSSGQVQLISFTVAVQMKELRAASHDEL